MKAVKTVRDTVTFVLDEADLTDKKVGQSVQVSGTIACSDGFKWSFVCYPGGKTKASKKYVDIDLHVSKTVSARYTLYINRRRSKLRTMHFTSPNGCHEGQKFASHELLRRIFVDGQLYITCNAEFDVVVPFSFLIPRLMRYADGISTDFEVVIGTDRLKVHKSLLSLISPTFNAMLTHDSAEAKSGKVDIKDFDFETVKAGIDFCYGREPENLCVDTIVGILSFADKYDIKAVTDDLAMIPLVNLSPDTFATIAHYAYDCSKDELFETCCSFFIENRNNVIKTKQFAALAPSFVAHLLKQAFDLKTQFDVLRYAYAKKIHFILEPLEQPIIEALSLDTFCDTVKYAWDCSRDELKNACGKFFNDNQAEILKLKETFDLPPSLLYKVLKKGYDVL